MVNHSRTLWPNSVHTSQHTAQATELEDRFADARINSGDNLSIACKIL